MNLATYFSVIILASVLLLTGFLVTFSLISGKLRPFDLFPKIETLTNNYLLMGVIVLAAIIIFGTFLFLKEKFLGHT
jgi:hypothetical protein